MDNISFSISPLPPFAAVTFQLPVDKVVRGIFKRSPRPPLAGELVAWCLQQVLSDQFTEGDAKGAWSKRYAEYLHFIWGQKDIPGDISIHDTITYSAWIASALMRYKSALPEEPVSRAILPRLQLFTDYLKRHYNPKTGGFGLSTRPKSRGSAGIDTDLRHSIWAVLTLWELGATDSELMEMLRDTDRYIVNEIEQLDLNRERAITCAVLHKLLTTDGVRSILVFQEAHRQAVIKQIESVLVERFDTSYGSWDIDRDIPEKAGIDNALFVLTSVNARACIDKDCVKVFQTAVNRLCSNYLLRIDEKELGLPFYDGGEPDIGASLQLLWIIYQNRELVDVKEEVIKQLLNFVINPSSRDNVSNFAYPWHLASALCLSSEYA